MTDKIKEKESATKKEIYEKPALEEKGRIKDITAGVVYEARQPD